MKAMISTHRISGESIQVSIETGNDSIQFICNNDQVMLKLLKLQIDLFLKA